jgi:rSAM/selenodomain-associated transferase 2
VDTLSIVIPVLNDALALTRLLECLRSLLSSEVAGATEIIVADGGSSDEGCAVARRNGCVLVQGQASRGAQLQRGFESSRGQWIWMLHADSIPEAEAVAWLVQPRAPGWGRFDVCFPGARPLLKMVATLMNWRSRRSGIWTGDQGIFVHRSLLNLIGGVPTQSLMEDIELSKRLKREMAPLCPRLRLMASSRRWEHRGVVRTIVSMWWFRLRYWRGADPERLADEYYS